jgi:hypothetical protein
LADCYNHCLDAQIATHWAITPNDGSNPAKLNGLKAVEQCEGF